MQNNADLVELGEKLDRLREKAAGLASRVRLWANKRLEALHLGMLTRTARRDEPEPRYVWRLGATEKHCRDCARLNGQVHTASEWARAGIRPQSADLECGGWRCDCRLEQTEDESAGMEFGV